MLYAYYLVHLVCKMLFVMARNQRKFSDSLTRSCRETQEIQDLGKKSMVLKKLNEVNESSGRYLHETGRNEETISLSDTVCFCPDSDEQKPYY